MSFTDKQKKALRAKLSWRHVKTRAAGASTIAYVEGWHAIAEANRIFGYDSWDRTTLSPRCLWTETRRSQVVCFYSTKVRITVRAGGCLITREGIGTGVGHASIPEAAHEMALKAAETDATKRALATFGNPFGLALYDKDQTNVTRPPKEAGAPAAKAGADAEKPADLVLVWGDRRLPYGNTEAFTAAILRAIGQLSTIESVYAFWEANLETLKLLRRRVDGEDHDPVVPILGALKARARSLGHVVTENSAKTAEAGGPREPSPELPLAIPKEQRIRDKDHLAYVAKQPCLVCGRRPAHAHHLKFAQPRAMAMKVSDEFTVPLCAAHHDGLHRTGDEQAWWGRHGIIDPLKVAARLWRETRRHGRSPQSLGSFLGTSTETDDATLAPSAAPPTAPG